MHRHLVISLTVLALWALPLAAAPLVMQNDSVRIAFDEGGQITELVDLATGTNYAATGGNRRLCSIEFEDGTTAVCTSLSAEGGAVTVGFDRPGVSLTLSVESREGYFVVGLEDVAGDGIAAVTFLNLATEGLKRRTYAMNAAYNDDFVTGAFALDLPVGGLTSWQTVEGERLIRVTATCYSRIGPPAGNRVAVYGCPQAQIRELVERIEVENGLPHPTYEGVWTKLSPEVRKSYLFLLDLTAANADRAIEYARRGGFGMIMIDMHCWADTWGHCEINPDNFPRGMDGLQDVCDKIRQAGMQVALHVAACCAISQDDAYVTPVPDPGLLKDAVGELAADISADDDLVLLAGPPDGFPAEKASVRDNGLDVQIGDEIITYTSLQTEEPYGLAGCVRGAYGTQRAAHAKGAQVHHLRRYYGRFVYELHSPLGQAYTGRLAEVCDAVGAAMLYMDYSKFGPDEWYYASAIQFAIYDKLENKDVFMQGGRTFHSSWHLMSRTASADGYEDWKGHLNGRLLGFAADQDHRFLHMPREVGWYGLTGAYGWMSTEAFWYIRIKGLGFDAPLSLSSRVRWLDEHPRALDLLDINRVCETAHVQRLLSDEQLAQCRELDVDYTLALDDEGGARLQRVTYDPPVTLGSEVGLLSWSISSDAAAPVGFELDLRMARRTGPGAAYEEDVVARVEDFEDLEPFEEKWVLEDCTHEWRAEPGRSGEQCLVYEATNNSATAQGHSGMGRAFDPPLSLPEHESVGFWVRCDGKGEWIKFQLLDADGGVAVYPVRASFDGWSYVEIAAPTPFRDLDYSRITGMIVYYQGVPPGETCVCALDGIRALGSVSPTGVRGLELTLRGEPIAMPDSDERVDMLVLSPDGSCRLLGPGGVTVAATDPAEQPPQLLPGENPIEFRFDPDAGSCEFEARVMRLLP